MKLFVYIILSVIFLNSCSGKAGELKKESVLMNDTNAEFIVLGAGCFWCVEAVFQDLNGVLAVNSGYTGGKTKNPTYKEVCSGSTGHAEAVKITFDPKIITLGEILEVFFATHDPTTLNRQGADAGTQYRSAIFYTDENQKITAQKLIDSLTKSNEYDNPIVTEVSKLGDFYEAEDYHQNYFNDNSNQPYCVFVINPKLEKLKKRFKDKLKK